MFRSPRLLLLPLLFALAFVAHPAGAQVWLDPLQNDAGVYQVYFRDRLLGTERFSFEPRGDSVVVYSNIDQVLPTPDGDKPLAKKTEMSVKALDYGLLGYQSEQDFLGRHVLRGINPHDTTVTTFRESNEMGSAETYERPPGRFFVIDGQVFVLFDIMLRSLHGKMIGERPLSVMVLGEPRDSVLEIRFQPGEPDTLRLDRKTWPTRRVTFTDGTTDFVAWVSAKGAMLRLEQPALGLRVVRVLQGKEPPTGAASEAVPVRNRTGSSPPRGH